MYTRKSKSVGNDGSCPTGYHKRRAYTVKKTGTRVEASCVRATTTQGPRANFLRETRRRRTRRLQGFPVAERGPTTCPRGTILRDPYVRIRKGVTQHVPASCIRDVGREGKGLSSGAPGIGPLRKGDLAQFGYSQISDMSVGDRHKALDAAIKKYGSLSIWRKLNALYIYTRNTSIESSQRFKADRDWIKSTYGIRAF